MAKSASLSSHLLVRDAAPPQSGFVIPFGEAVARPSKVERAATVEQPVVDALGSRGDAVSTTRKPVETNTTGEAQKLVRALREGDLRKAERLFAQLCQLPPHTARRVFYGTSGHWLAIACRALGLDQLLFVSILILSRKLGKGDPDSQPEQLATAIRTFEQQPPASAREQLLLWRRDGADPFI